jgi:hypothetical protein
MLKTKPMRKHPAKIAEVHRVKNGQRGTTRADGNNGAFKIPSPVRNQDILYVIASDGGGWDHVSASLKMRTPIWKELCFIKDLFWEPEETVIQYHPPASKYINQHYFVLHLWRPQEMEIPMPQINFV